MAEECDGGSSKAAKSNGFLELGEIRAATDADFDYFMRLAECTDNWIKKLDKNGLTVWQKETGHSTIKLAKVRTEFHGISASTAFDTIMDGEYRKTWDENVIEDYEICKLNDWNDIGYYSMKCPGPLKNRDLVNQRSWRVFSEDQFIIFNHSVQHHEIPPKKNFIRALSYVTGFLIRSCASGSELTYVTQSDPRGKLPKWIINMAVNKIAPAIFKKLFAAASKYEEWKAKNKPDYKPWRNPEQNSLPLADVAELRQKLVEAAASGQPLLNGDQDEEVPSEENMEEYVEHLVESLEHEKN